MKFRLCTVLVVFLLSMISAACLPTPLPPTPTPSPTLTPTQDNPCLSARITMPEGGQARSSARSYPVSNNTEISWEPSRGCPMTIQYYQDDILIGQFDNVLPDSELLLTGSGETEIKIWVDGTEVAHIWVWLGEPTPPS